MKYYLHDSSAFQDEKITELFINFGYEGLGLFYTLLEKLAFQEKPIKTLVLKKQLKVGKRLEKCWSFMEKIELINTNNGETFNKQLLNFSEKYQIKNKKNAERISQWREKQKDTENVTHYESVRNTPKVNRSKVNRSKVNINNNISEVFFPFDSVNFKNEWIRWKDYKKLQHRFTYKGSDTEQTAINSLYQLSNGNEAIAIQIIKQSISNGWKGLFELKTANINNPHAPAPR